MDTTKTGSINDDNNATKGDKVVDWGRPEKVFTVIERMSLRYWKVVDASGWVTVFKNNEFRFAD